MADEKITQKTALTTPAGEDLLYIVDDPSGTPDGKKITLTNLFGNVPVQTTIDVTSTEAFLVRKSGDGGDRFYINSQASATGVVAKIYGALEVEAPAVLNIIYENDSTDYWWRWGVDGGTLLFDYDDDQDGAFTPYSRYFQITKNGVAKLSGTLEIGTPPTYSESNVTTDRTYDANSTTTAELADIVGTLIADLRAMGLVD